ncbi:hypothetical protein KI387_000220, partial [Taxus chinensis]
HSDQAIQLDQFGSPLQSSRLDNKLDRQFRVVPLVQVHHSHLSSVRPGHGPGSPGE